MEFERQHIVPKSYLKRFATQNPKNGKYIIGVRDKYTRLFIQSIENVGYLKNYYDTKYHNDDKFWEHYFANEIEPIYGKDLDRIITKTIMSRSQTIVLDECDKYALTTMMCFQMLRNPDYIEKITHILPSFINNHKKDIIKCNPKLTAEQIRIIKKISYSKTMCKEEIFKFITNSERYKRFAAVLANKAWFVFLNTASRTMPFITSDNPVVFCRLLPGNKSDFGIGRKDTLIYYPITPSILIGIFPAVLFSANIKNGSDTMKMLTKKDLEFITNINKRQIDNCYQQAFLPLNFYNNLKMLLSERN